jgi:membrane-bound lytic murein transglycosylase D
MFQGLLLQCAPFRALFQDAATQRGLPSELMALVMAESGCALDSESATGGRGLWHLTPERARAYHLEVKTGVLDERSSAAKSTDAALELVNDLYQKLGSWELAIAAYRLGPFSVLARMQQAGRDVTYRDLANAGALPADTLEYVAKVEAFAVVLANLDHFRFQAPPQGSAERASLLLVPAGTRLGLVARAVGTSTSKIRELNPELIADTVPGAANAQFSLQVPGDANPRARDTLDRLIAEGDDADECVPLNFDWGRQRFTRQMSSRCKR